MSKAPIVAAVILAAVSAANIGYAVGRTMNGKDLATAPIAIGVMGLALALIILIQGRKRSGPDS